MDKVAHRGARGTDDQEQTWQRLLSLEHEVRELRRLLLADASHLDPAPSCPEHARVQVGPPASATTRPADWQVTFLGAFQLRCAGRIPPTCSSRRGWGILQYLLVRPGHAATRDSLIETFWPDAEPYAGAHSLQMAIHALRRTLRGCGPGGNDAAILFRDGQYGVNPALTIESDIQRFRAACERGRMGAGSGQLEVARRAFEAALTLYVGPFLPESSHDEWAEPDRVALQDLRLNVLGWLSDVHAARAEWDQAAALSQEVLAADPYREDAIRQILRGLAATGRLAEVERTYRACRERIWLDLQVEPAPETVRLYQQLTRPALRASALSGRTGS